MHVELQHVFTPPCRALKGRKGLTSPRPYGFVRNNQISVLFYAGNERSSNIGTCLTFIYALYLLMGLSLRALYPLI